MYKYKHRYPIIHLLRSLTCFKDMVYFSVGDVTTSPSNEVTTEMVNRQTSEETVDEHDFELCGTDEEIE